MRIDNATHWRSDHILAIARRVAETELDPAKRKHYTIRVRYGHRGAWTSGHAAYFGSSCQVNVGKDAVDTVNLAHTIAHEMAHSRGVRHPAMRGSVRYRYVNGWRDFYAWASAMPVEQYPVKPKPTLDARRAARLENAQRKLLQWERAVRLAQNRARRWRTRVRNLERYIVKAASAAPKEKT